ncbi:MAG: M66 family metalloprotease, partial [Polyangiales bacterium]
RIGASGSGFDELLDSVVSLRISDKAPRDVYYYGAFANASSFDAYCGGGCVTGLCGLTDDESDSTVRACVGVGFTGKYSAETMTHEVGHAHGRYHAPCGGAAGTDPSYPYTGAKIGVWGYDLVAKKLMDPARNVDLMSYCNPVFVSDFQYQGLLERMAAIASGKMMKLPAPAAYRFVRVRADGSLAWGKPVELHEPPMGAPRAILFEDALGAPLATAVGHFYPYDHLPGGMLLVPQGPAGFTSLRVIGVAGTVDARLDATLPR